MKSTNFLLNTEPCKQKSDYVTVSWFHLCPLITHFTHRLLQHLPQRFPWRTNDGQD